MIKPILLNRALESKHNLSKNPANYLPIQNGFRSTDSEQALRLSSLTR